MIFILLHIIYQVNVLCGRHARDQKSSDFSQLLWM